MKGVLIDQKENGFCKIDDQFLFISEVCNEAIPNGVFAVTADFWYGVIVVSKH